MKSIKVLPTFFAVILMLLVMTACSKNTNDTVKPNNSADNQEKVTVNKELSEDALNICGSWAYIHDKETAVAVFHEDGTAEYDGNKYTFDCDSEFITLKDSANETIQLRYVLDDKGMYLYQKNTYAFDGNDQPDGLVGRWICAEKKWYFEFTEKGTFMEDGYFSGNYTVDQENSTFKLAYTEQIEDTLCYFQIDGNKLNVEYPWQMVKMDTK